MHKKSKSIYLEIDCDDRHIIKLFEQFVIESMVGEIKLHIKKILGKLNFSLDYFFSSNINFFKFFSIYKSYLT